MAALDVESPVFPSSRLPLMSDRGYNACRAETQIKLNDTVKTIDINVDNVLYRLLYISMVQTPKSRKRKHFISAHVKKRL